MTRPKKAEVGWFEDEKEYLLPTINEKNTTISQTRAAIGEKKEELSIKLCELKI